MRWKMGKLLEPHFTGMYFPSLGEFDLDGDGTIDLLLYDDKAPESKPNKRLRLAVLSSSQREIMVIWSAF